MQRRHILPALLALMAPAPGLAQTAQLSADVIDRPPARRVFASPSGRFVLSLTVAAHGQTSKAEAELVEVFADRRVGRWQLPLPHEGGPRTAVVSDRGAVLLVEEWINVVPRHALMVIGSDGRTIADDSGEQVFSRLEVPRARISEHARAGIWRSSDPVLAEDGNSVVIRAAGRVVTVSLADGHLDVD